MKPEGFKSGIKVMAKSVEYVPSYHASSSLYSFVISLLFVPVRRHLCTTISYQLQILKILFLKTDSCVIFLQYYPIRTIARGSFTAFTAANKISSNQHTS